MESRPELLLQPVNGNTSALNNSELKDKRRNMMFSWRNPPGRPRKRASLTALNSAQLRR
jgi:hypothetical protein